MLCLIHGYSLTGSGSNLWTRAIAHGLCENGETVHLVCQEPRPEQYDFIAEVYRYDADGHPEQVLARDVPYEGRCILHRPHIDVLPTYVRPKSDITSMAAIVDMSREAIDAYLGYNEAALHHVVTTHGITTMHVNHVVLMAVAACRVSARTDVPFSVMPHGSAIEYVVRQDARMHALAEQALDAADRILTLSTEMQQRIRDVFPNLSGPNLSGASEKMVMASAGVDTQQFRVIDRAERPASIRRLQQTIAETERGRTPEQTHAMQRQLRDDLTLEALQALLSRAADYPPKRPDADLEARLDAVDWTRAEVVTFVGNIIGHKGVPSLVAAFPEVLARHPEARLVIAGRGGLREPLEAFVWALAHGLRQLARHIVQWGGLLEGEPEAGPFTRVVRYFEQLEAEDRLDAYFAHAERHLKPEHVLFTGYMEHAALCHLFPCCDAAVFPSVVKEAAPLVVPEAMASGVFPLGTDFAGMSTSLDIAARAVPAEMAPLMRLRPDPAYTVADIVEQVPAALDVGDRYRRAFREVAVRDCDWRNVARRLSEELHAAARTA